MVCQMWRCQTGAAILPLLLVLCIVWVGNPWAPGSGRTPNIERRGPEAWQRSEQSKKRLSPQQQDLLQRMRTTHVEHVASVCSEQLLHDVAQWQANAVALYASIERTGHHWTAFSALPFFIMGRNDRSGFADSLTSHVSAFTVTALTGNCVFVEDLFTSALEYVGATTPAYMSLRRRLLTFVREAPADLSQQQLDLHVVPVQHSNVTLIRGGCRNEKTNEQLAACLMRQLTAPQYARRQAHQGSATVVDFHSNRGVLFQLESTNVTLRARIAAIHPLFPESASFDVGRVWGCMANYMMRPGPALVRYIDADILQAVLDPDTTVIGVHIRWGYLIPRLFHAAKNVDPELIKTVLGHRDAALIGEEMALPILSDPEWFAYVGYSMQQYVSKERAAGRLKRRVRFLIAADSQTIKRHLAQQLGLDKVFIISWPPGHSKDKNTRSSFLSEDNEALAKAQAEWYILGMVDVFFATIHSGFSRLAAARAYPRQRLFVLPIGPLFQSGNECTGLERDKVAAYIDARLSNATAQKAFPPESASMRLLFMRCMAITLRHTDFFDLSKANSFEEYGAHM